MAIDYYALGLANRHARNANDWQAYAGELENKLATANANVEAMETLARVAVKELGKVDPNNYLMVHANRQKIVDEAYAKA